MTIGQITKLQAVNNWLKDTIKRCERESKTRRANRGGNRQGELLEMHIIPWLEDQEHHVFIKLRYAEDNPKEVI